MNTHSADAKRSFWLGFVSCAGCLVLVLAVVLVGFAALGVHQLRSRAADLVTPHLQPPPLPTEPKAFDYEWTLEGLDGEPFDFESLWGQTVLLNFWATWCVPCLSEISLLEELDKQVRPDGVRIFLLTDETQDVVDSFLEDRPIGLPVYLIPKGERRPEFSRRIPTTLVLNSQGQVVLRHVGAADWAADEVVGFIRRVASEDASIEQPGP